MKPTLNLVLNLIGLLLVFDLEAQNCSGNTFVPPTAPATCTYSYTTTGWVNALGLPTLAPTSSSSGESICILANYTGDFLFNIRGTFYVASGIQYTGTVTGFTSTSKILAAGEINFTTTTPSLAGLSITIGTNGILSVPGDFAPGGAATVHNAGQLNVGGHLSLGGQASMTSYENSKVIVQGDASINAPFNNCGLFEVVGSLGSGGSSGLKNLCSTYIHTDMTLNADYTNYGLIIIDGSLNFGSSVFNNDDILVVNNIDINNVSLIGNDKTSFLVVRNNAILSNNGIITGHLYYDVDDGGGFDSVCGGCTEGIDILLDVTLPSSNEEILANCGGDIVINPFIEESKLDFDGVDDHATTPNFINGESNVTIMAWVLSDSGNSTNMTIAGEDVGCRLWLENGNKPSFTLKTSATTLKTISASTNINYDEWHHITGTFSSTTGIMTLYVDGAFITSVNVGATGSTIANSASSNGNFEIGRRSTSSGSEYFKGDIDEVRVFNTVLTDSQIQRMVYQEIENNNGVVKGKVINKNITDISTNATISWTSLLSYYPLSLLVSNSRTSDFSSFDRITKLHNITTFQDETAPIPYISKDDGDWTSTNTWLYGSVWDIVDAANNKDWSIIQIKNNVTTSNSVKSIGLFIDTDKTLTVNGSNQVLNSWYLELNGTLDLKDDSQLLQTSTSDLVTSATGKILRRQEGTSNAFRYNYWSSPVGTVGATSLTDNNTATNNTNNTPFKINMLKDETGFNMQFTSAYNEVGKISTYWLYTFKNGITYWDWASFNPNTTLLSGVGYTQKGTGNAGLQQQYIFEGKPNNGTILLNVTDVGGPGSITSVSKTEYLFGNPYPSALDVNKFIDDNAGVIDGTLQLWQQWAGDSHYLNEYKGGYAQVNKLGSCRAYQFVGIEGANNGSQDGTITPSKYLPVGQGFITEIIANGTVVFNNSQRVFIKEADADGTYDNGATFFKSVKTKSKSTTKPPKDQQSTGMKKIRLEFNSIVGPKIRREVLLGFSETTADGYDYGYDAECDEGSNNDFNLNLDGKNMNIQAYGPITADKVVSLNFKSSGNNTFEIKATEFENIDKKQDVYLRDNETGEYFDLTQNTAYRFTSTQGKFNKRFEIVFQSEQKSLSTEEATVSENFIFYQNATNTIYGKKLNTSIDKLSIVNMRGQTVLEFKNVSQETLNNGLKISNVATGAYLAWFKTKTGQVITKKIIVN